MHLLPCHTKFTFLLFLVLTGPQHVNCVRIGERTLSGSTKEHAEGTENSQTSGSSHAEAKIFDELEFEALCDAGLLTSIRPMSQSQLTAQVPYLQGQLVAWGGAVAGQVSDLVQGVQDGIWGTITEIPGYLGPYLKYGFWSEEGSYSRMIADYAFDFYAKNFCTFTDKTQLVLARSMRYATEHPGKTAAIVAGSTLVIGGLVHLWYSREPKKVQMLTDGSASNSSLALSVEPVNLDNVQTQLVQVSGVVRGALSSPPGWLKHFDGLQLRCVQRLVLSEIMKPSLKFLSFAVVDAGGMSDEEVKDHFKHSSSTVRQIRDALDRHRYPETLNLDLQKLVAASPEDADIIYPSLAPISVQYDVGSPQVLEIAISMTEWNSPEDLLKVVSRWRQELGSNDSGKVFDLSLKSHDIVQF